MEGPTALHTVRSPALRGARGGSGHGGRSFRIRQGNGRPIFVRPSQDLGESRGAITPKCRQAPCQCSSTDRSSVNLPERHRPENPPPNERPSPCVERSPPSSPVPP